MADASARAVTLVTETGDTKRVTPIHTLSKKKWGNVVGSKEKAEKRRENRRGTGERLLYFPKYLRFNAPTSSKCSSHDVTTPTHRHPPKKNNSSSLPPNQSVSVCACVARLVGKQASPQPFTVCCAVSARCCEGGRCGPECDLLG